MKFIATSARDEADDGSQRRFPSPSDHEPIRDRCTTDAGPIRNRTTTDAGPMQERTDTDAEIAGLTNQMTLLPPHPPGRSTRKARIFEADIGRLHRLGYSFEAIRRALAEAGVHVSRSTVQREVARHSGRISQVQAPRQPAPAPSGPPACAPTPSEYRSGKELAAEFMKGRITNPLFRNRS